MKELNTGELINYELPEDIQNKKNITASVRSISDKLILVSMHPL